jgi:hypothetical protein
MVLSNLNSLQFSLCETARLSQHDVAIVLVEEPNLGQKQQQGWRRSLLKVLSLSLKHIQAGRRIAAEKRRDAVILPDFSTEFLLLTYLFSGGRTRNVHTLIHHNVQQALHSRSAKELLRFYHWLGYKFILNETLSALTDLGYQDPQNQGHAVLLHPVQAETAIVAAVAQAAPISERPKVGIVGSIRKGKQVEATIAQLQKLQARLEFILVIGVDQPEQLKHLQHEHLVLMNTAEHEDYLKVIGMCDVIVLNYDEAQYRYRCSGVAADAIGTRTYVVAPDYPMMRHQLLYPEPVGVLYETETELESALAAALKLPAAVTNPAFEQHYAQRSVQGLAMALDRILAARPRRRRPILTYPKPSAIE